MCGEYGLEVHHLTGYAQHPELAEDVSNGVCLCFKHHMGFHSRYGTVKFTKENYYEYKQSENCSNIAT